MYIIDYPNINKEFDSIIYKIQRKIDESNIALYGKGIYINETLRCLEQYFDCNITIFDGDEELWEKELSNEDNSYVIQNPEKLYPDKFSIVIIVPYGQVRMDIEESLLKRGYSKENIFHAFEIIPLFFSMKGEIRLPDMAFLMGNICTLKCKDCAHQVPYARKFEYRDIDIFKREVDTFFSKVDYIQLIQIGTGEVFVNPNLYKYLSIILKWREKFGKVLIVSNGTVMPQGKNLEILKDEKIQICISNYDPLLIDNKSIIPKLQQVYAENNIKFNIAKYLGGTAKNTDAWSNIGNPSEKRNRSSEKNKEIYKNCANRLCHVFYKDEIHICSFSAMWDYNGIRDAKPNDSVKMTGDLSMIKGYLGIVQNGYPEICDWCDGMGDHVNNKVVKAAVQIK